MYLKVNFMFVKLFLTLGILIYAVGVPFLEINNPHVFNPDWSPHARINEVWQLITNSSIGLFSFWFVWIKKKVVLPCILVLLLTGGFLLAYFLLDFYGGSMQNRRSKKPYKFLYQYYSGNRRFTI